MILLDIYCKYIRITVAREISAHKGHGLRIDHMFNGRCAVVDQPQIGNSDLDRGLRGNLGEINPYQSRTDNELSLLLCLLLGYDMANLLVLVAERLILPFETPWWYNGIETSNILETSAAERWMDKGEWLKSWHPSGGQFDWRLTINASGNL